jgi:hypothetical protein
MNPRRLADNSLQRTGVEAWYHLAEAAAAGR